MGLDPGDYYSTHEHWAWQCLKFLQQKAESMLTHEAVLLGFSHPSLSFPVRFLRGKECTGTAEVPGQFCEVISEGHNTSLREGWLIAVGHGGVAFLTATLHLLAQVSTAGCSQHQVGQLARLRWEKSAPFNTAVRLPVPAEWKLLSSVKVTTVELTAHGVFSFLPFFHSL